MNLHPSSPRQIELRLLLLGAVVLFLFSAILSLSPAGRERTWDVTYRWSHWIGFLLWTLTITVCHWQLRRNLPDTDPYLFALTSLLAGLGILSVWRLYPSFGLRQALWFLVGGLVVIVGTKFSAKLSILRRYKYNLLVSGLFLTSLTLIFGTNPLGSGPHLWLGCCGFYLQPSEPLKLLLIIYLAAYLADNLPLRQGFFPLILPTLLLTGLALLILVVQRDLGTASIFIFLYTVILYLATGRKRVLIAAILIMTLAAVVGYYAVDTIRVRMVAWLNPWSDPVGAGYQTIQSLMAIANGGIPGRGPGMGYPSLVPVAVSDFIYSAIAEETGLSGTTLLLAILAVVIARGLRISLHARDTFQRLLAGGLTAYLGVQSILIIGGNLRLFPLTGVTLPFISYGGSSLVTSLVAVVLILIIGSQPEEDSAPLQKPSPYLNLSILFFVLLIGLAMTNLWWTIWRADGLLARTDNPRRSIADTYVPRGNLLDRSYQPINETTGESGSYSREYLYPNLGTVTGYTNNVYGQSGLELSLDPYLRGLLGHSTISLWWNRLLYGTPPPGSSVRLSIDLPLQSIADQLLGQHKGSIVLLNGKTGEVLAMASHPTFDPNQLSALGADLIGNKDAPLINRAAQGKYPSGNLLSIFSAANDLSSGNAPSKNSLAKLYNSLGFYAEPDVRLPAAPAEKFGVVDGLNVSPLQVALAATTLTNDGIRSPGQIAMAVELTPGEWVVLPPPGQPYRVFDAAAVDQVTSDNMAAVRPYWRVTAESVSSGSNVAWFMGGTPSSWQGTPLVAVVVLEDGNAQAADSIGQNLLQSAIK